MENEGKNVEQDDIANIEISNLEIKRTFKNHLHSNTFGFSYNCREKCLIGRHKF